MYSCVVKGIVGEIEVWEEEMWTAAAYLAVMHRDNISMGA